MSFAKMISKIFRSLKKVFNSANDSLVLLWRHPDIVKTGQFGIVFRVFSETGFRE